MDVLPGLGDLEAISGYRINMFSYIFVRVMGFGSLNYRVKLKFDIFVVLFFIP